MYDKGVFKSTEFDIPIISVGNLAVGGTGKTPMVEWLINHLQDQYTIGVLSRGYGRKTSGFQTVLTLSSPREVGDEALQIKLNYDKIHVCVCEDRVFGIAQMINNHPEINLIILDDAFQHRAVKPTISILLTTHNKPFTSDFIMPTGFLRERRKGYKRADAIVVTKCPDQYESLKLEQIELPVFYSSIAYKKVDLNSKIFGFSGLANNQVFKQFLESNYQLAGFKGYTDHANFTTENLEQIRKSSAGLPLVCTQKDWVKIKDFSNIEDVHYIQIRTKFKSEEFANWIDKRLKDES